MKVAAHAKINLHLQVLGRRPDGFHELRTLLQAIDLHDVVIAEAAPPGCMELSVDPPGSVAEDEHNLVLRAALALVELTGVEAGARLRLKKRIPVGAGLGGGSADAAAALVALNALWSLDLDASRLHAVARGLGSDVPFCLRGGLGLGVGRGDEVYPLADLPELGVLVVFPGVHLSTAEIYHRLGKRLTWTGLEDRVYAFASAAGDGPCWDRMVNDLEAVVCELCAEVAEVLDRLRSSGSKRVAVTGSGSAVYAIFDDAGAAQQAAERLGDRWWLHAGVTLTRGRSVPRVCEDREQRLY